MEPLKMYFLLKIVIFYGFVSLPGSMYKKYIYICYIYIMYVGMLLPLPVTSSH